MFRKFELSFDDIFANGNENGVTVTLDYSEHGIVLSLLYLALDGLPLTAYGNPASDNPIVEDLMKSYISSAIDKLTE